MENKDKLIKEVQALAEKSKRRANPFIKRKLYNRSLENLENSIEMLDREITLGSGEKWTNENIFSVSQNYSVNTLEKMKQYYTRFLSATEEKKYSDIARKVKDVESLGRTQAERLQNYSDIEEGKNFSNTLANTIGSDIIRQIYQIQKDTNRDINDIYKALYDTKNDLDLSTTPRSEILKTFANKLDKDLASTVLSAIK